MVLLPLLVVTAAAAAELKGTVQILQRGGTKVATGEDPRQVVVYYEPEEGGGARTTPRSGEVVTHRRSFEPRVLAVPPGSVVRFPNQDPILHNVFSVSQGNAFDLGLLGTGPGGEVRLSQPGVVRVFCNVHPDMVAYVLVLETPFVASPGRDGTFRLSGLPPGRGRLTVWHERAEPVVREVQLPAAAPLSLAVEITRPQVPPHLNKFGRRYGRSRDEYR
jgi:plastocyanin